MTVAGWGREREMVGWSAARGCALPVFAVPDRRLLPLFVICWRCFCLFYPTFRFSELDGRRFYVVRCDARRQEKCGVQRAMNECGAPVGEGGDPHY